MEWRPVSPRLATVRRLVAHLSFAPFVLAGAVVAALWWRWAAIPAALLLLLWLWTIWFVGRHSTSPSAHRSSGSAMGSIMRAIQPSPPRCDVRHDGWEDGARTPFAGVRREQ